MKYTNAWILLLLPVLGSCSDASSIVFSQQHKLQPGPGEEVPIDRHGVSSDLSVVSAAAGQDSGFLGSARFKNQQPLWAYSGVWAFDTSSFYVVDILDESIKQFSLTGDYLRKVKGADLGVESFSPSFIKLSGERFVVQNAGGRFVWLDSRASRVIKIVPIMDQENESGARVAALSSWQLCGDHIVGFADIATSSEWTFGYVKVPVHQPSDFSIIETFDPRSSVGLLSRLGIQYVAPLPEGGCAIWLGDRHKLWIVKPDSLMELGIDLVEGNFDKPWENWKQNTDHVERFHSVSDSRLGTELFVDTEFYYFLIRTPPGWKIEKVRREDLTSAGVWTLPTEAEHLIAIPGENAWILIEKGKVNGMGDQQIHTFLVVDPMDFQVRDQVSH